MPEDAFAAAQNMLTDAEREAGWRLLFDGVGTEHWRGYRAETFPDGWVIDDGALHRAAPAGDIITIEQFTDLDLKLEWRVEGAGNSGIFFRVSEDHERVWETGPEMQVLNNAVHPDGRDPQTAAGSNYALHAPPRDLTRPIGEWNAVRLLVHGQHVELWLNGKQVVTYELFSEDWERRVAASKFATMPRYGRNARGHIALQDHGDPVWFRNIRLLVPAGSRP
jgi:hypothetical protein